METRFFFEELPSTQAHAVELARRGAPVGVTVRAAAQSAGVGRADHRWVSPPGGLYLSTVGPDVPAGPPLLPLALGAALQGEFARRWSVRSQVKWPNDVIQPGPGGYRKIAGVLTERIVGDAGPRTVVGLGINVQARPAGFPPELADHVAFLEDIAAPPPSVDEVERMTLEAVRGVFADLAVPAHASRWIARCRQALYGLGLRVRVDGSPLGRIAGLGEDGALWVDGPQGRVEVRAGEVQVEVGS